MNIHCYDPRDPKQLHEKPETWRKTDNPALMLAHSAASRCRHVVDENFWKRVAGMANDVEAVI